MLNLESIQRNVRRYGFAGSLRRTMVSACRAMARMPYLRECHVWYRMDLTGARPRIELPAGFELVHARTHDLPLLEQLETIGLSEAKRRLAAGADLWIVREGAHAVFSCWIFRHRTPVLAAPGGWLVLPADTVCLEDSVTSARYRGRGVAPAAWSRVADALAREGVAAIITKIAEDNAPSRRAGEKAGFRLVASMSLVRICLRPRVQVSPESDGAPAFLVEHLTR